MKNELSQYSLTIPPKFPDLWKFVLDEVIPVFVKNRFSPQDSWKNKPFSQSDVVFFSKGLLELSDFFTEDREESRLPNYFTTARFRSSYFLYFFALQGAKFLTLFDRYPKAIEAAIAHGKKTGRLRIIDVGAGPGTASLALLIHIMDRYKEKKRLPFSIDLHWIDHNGTILKDGEALAELILEMLPDFKVEVDLTIESRSWWKHPPGFDPKASIVLFGNVLNESSGNVRIFQQGLAPLLKAPEGAGVLIVEPAFKVASQRVSQIRDELMPHPLWGPCLHTQKCPLAIGRDWCHFSVPAELPGKLFKKFSIKLGGVRDWLKFSFVWIASKNSEKEAVTENLAPIIRVVSDPLKTDYGRENQLCVPERLGWFPTPNYPLHRGDVIRYSQGRNDQIFQPNHKKSGDRKSVRDRPHRSRVQK